MPERTELVDKIVLNSLQTYFENWPLATAEDIVIFILTVTTLTVASLTLDIHSYKSLRHTHQLSYRFLSIRENKRLNEPRPI